MVRNFNMKKKTLQQAVKLDSGKLRYELVPEEAFEEVVKVYNYGAKKYDEKYGENNWAKGMKWSRIYGAVRRHLKEFYKGKDYDDESGLLHVAHACWGCLTLIHYSKFNKEFDDRPRYGRHKRNKNGKQKLNGRNSNKEV